MDAEWVKVTGRWRLCDTSKTSGKDKKERIQFNEEYKAQLGDAADKCIECTCLISDTCSHGMCTKEKKCKHKVVASKRPGCSKVAAHVHKKGGDKVYLVRACLSCNSQPTCWTGKVPQTVIALDIHTKLSDYK